MRQITSDESPPTQPQPSRMGNRTIRASGVRKSLASVPSYKHMFDTFGLQDTLPGPSQIWLIPDGDDPPGRQNFPDP